MQRHDCADTLTFTVTNGSYWIYKQLVNRGYKILIYSGNTDLVLNFFNFFNFFFFFQSINSTDFFVSWFYEVRASDGHPEMAVDAAGWDESGDDRTTTSVVHSREHDDGALARRVRRTIPGDYFCRSPGSWTHGSRMGSRGILGNGQFSSQRPGIAHLSITSLAMKLKKNTFLKLNSINPNNNNYNNN